jgi:hypothetical protein
MGASFSNGYLVLHDYNTVMDLLKALLGSSLVGTFECTQRTTILWKCFEWTVAIQRMCSDLTQQCVGIT